jgi:hypothetical protein
MIRTQGRWRAAPAFDWSDPRQESVGGTSPSEHGPRRLGDRSSAACREIGFRTRLAHPGDKDVVLPDASPANPKVAPRRSAPPRRDTPTAHPVPFRGRTGTSPWTSSHRRPGAGGRRQRDRGGGAWSAPLPPGRPSRCARCDGVGGFRHLSTCCTHCVPLYAKLTVQCAPGHVNGMGRTSDPGPRGRTHRSRPGRTHARRPAGAAARVPEPPSNQGPRTEERAATGSRGRTRSPTRSSSWSRAVWGHRPA